MKYLKGHSEIPPNFGRNLRFSYKKWVSLVGILHSYVGNIIHSSLSFHSMPTKNRRHTKKETNETLADVEQKQHLVANFVSVCLMYVPILSRKIWFGSLNFELNSLAQTEFYQQNNKIAIFFFS